ncbi:hypothetical protein ACVNP0_01645 [Staphylococcus aureus]
MTNRENPTPLKFLSYIIGLSMILLITLFISTLEATKIQASTIIEAIFNYNPSNQQQNIIN